MNERGETRLSQGFLKHLSLAFLTAQNAAIILLIRYARTRVGVPMFKSTTAVFLSELIKVIGSVALGAFTEGSIFRLCHQIHYVAIVKPMDSVLMTVPSILYVLQNNLVYVAISHLEVTTFMITFELRILTTALFSVLILKKVLSRQQNFAMLLLFVGVAIVQMQNTPPPPQPKLVFAPALNYTSNAQQNRILPVPEDPKMEVERIYSRPKRDAASVPQPLQQNRALGFAAVLGAATLSGFSSVYLEKMLAGSESGSRSGSDSGSRSSVWVRNIQLAFVGLPTSLVAMFIETWKNNPVGLENADWKVFLTGFDAVAWGCVLLYAVGGLVVAVVIKHAGNLLKVFATSFSIALAAVASVYVFGTVLTPAFTVGAGLVFLAVILYAKGAV